MTSPQTEDSLFDGDNQLHDFTEPMSSNFWEPREEQALPSSPPMADVEMATDMDTDQDTDADDAMEGTIVGAPKAQSTYRTPSNAAQAVARRSFSTNDVALDAFSQRVIDDPDSMIDGKGVLTVSYIDQWIEEIPANLADLQHVVSPGRLREIKIFLGKNRINTVPVSLFALSRITVLSLRDNQIEQLPPAIAELTSLSELHVGGNRLRWLPHELVDLNLRTLTCTPNPLLVPSATARQFRTEQGDRYEDVWVNEEAPSLLDLTLAAYLGSTHPQYLARLPDSLRLKVGYYHQQAMQCSQCRRLMVYEAAAVLRWENRFGQSMVPFKLQFCTRFCYMSYLFPHSGDASVTW